MSSIHLATPSSLETILNNTLSKLFPFPLSWGPHSFLSHPRPHFCLWQMSHKSPSASYTIRAHGSAYWMAMPLLKLSSTQLTTCLNLLGLCFSIFGQPHSCFEIHSVLLDWFQRLWWTALLLVSCVFAPPNQGLLLKGPTDQVFLFLPFGFAYFLPTAFPKRSLNPNHDMPQFVEVMPSESWHLHKL